MFLDFYQIRCGRDTVFDQIGLFARGAYANNQRKDSDRAPQEIEGDEHRE